MIVNYLITGKVDLFATRIFVGMQWNLVPGKIETMADFYDWLGHPAIANQMRLVGAFIGMRAHPGSSSTFINVDAFF